MRIFIWNRDRYTAAFPSNIWRYMNFIWCIQSQNRTNTVNVSDKKSLWKIVGILVYVFDLFCPSHFSFIIANNERLQYTWTWSWSRVMQRFQLAAKSSNDISIVKLYAVFRRTRWRESEHERKMCRETCLCYSFTWAKL